ncbi:MAG: AAA family ATPase [Alphaproteobacteria bacterium]|nr:AAA family ATPase [Alphaproteobacteria bacterium]
MTDGEDQSKSESLSLKLPSRIDGDESDTIDISMGSSLLFVGPNGAGKTRLAGYIDHVLESKCIYISAHRDLGMPTSYQVTDTRIQFQQIYGKAHWGEQPPTLEIQKTHRYQSGGTAFNSSDFPAVLNVLATKHTADVAKFRDDFDPKSPSTEKPKTILEKAIDIWSVCLPNLEIKTSVTPRLIIVRKSNRDTEYEPDEMSDGERALFYLVAKCMIADAGALIVVDEPELHIHRALRNQFWDLVEAQRPDCAFAYFTHDVDFSSTRSFALRIILHAFELNEESKSSIDGRWNWTVIEPSEDLPDDLYITVLGSRTNTLLVEGEKGSLDPMLARLVYPKMMVEPIGSCEKVIRSVKALNGVTKFHTTKAFGLIDSDFRSSTQLDEFESDNIYAHRFREIENVLACKAVLTAILTNFGRVSEAQKTTKKLADIISSRIIAVKNKFVIALSVRQAEISYQTALNEVIKTQSNLEDTAGLHNPAAIQSHCLSTVDDIIESADLDRLLGVFSIRKNELKDIYARLLGQKDWAHLKLSIEGWCRSPDSENGKRLIAAITDSFPKIDY